MMPPMYSSIGLILSLSGFRISLFLALYFQKWPRFSRAVQMRLTSFIQQAGIRAHAQLSFFGPQRDGESDAVTLEGFKSGESLANLCHFCLMMCWADGGFSCERCLDRYYLLTVSCFDFLWFFIRNFFLDVIETQKFKLSFCFILYIFRLLRWQTADELLGLVAD